MKFREFIRNILSVEPAKGRFFRPVDWTAFWGATAIAFLVYFFTLGPSVGLEDSGELATAGDHLGVPHPPGYPFWTLCSYLFCRLFSWVTYQGHPTPAYAISLLSAVFGALAAGCAAMLITRSASDWLDGNRSSSASISASSSPAVNAKIALAAGLGGSLVFAFSPVEWSQSTIVEIYSLNALFLMAVFLFSYRWMRKPSDRVLWAAAFVFGLGLTNYQVLLLAIVPLAIIIFLRNIRLFRDTVALAIPVALMALTLSVASLDRASNLMDADVIPKHLPVGEAALVIDSGRQSVTNQTMKSSSAEDLPAARWDGHGRMHLDVNAFAARTPPGWLLWIAFLLAASAPVAGAWRKRRGANAAGVRHAVLATGMTGVALALAAGTIFAHTEFWTREYEAPLAPLVQPFVYVSIGAMLALACTLAAAAALAPDGENESAGKFSTLLAGAAAAGALAVVIAMCVPAAGLGGYIGELRSMTGHDALQIAGLAALFALTAFTPRGLAFAVPVAAVQLSAMFLLHNGALNGLTHPQSWWFFWPILWNLAALALAYVALPTGPSIAPAFLFGELGVSFYAYMPLVSDLRNPPMNWGYPRTWEGFKHALTRGQYEAITMPDIFSKAGFNEFLDQLGFYFEDLRLQFTLVAAALAALPFTLWRVTIKTSKRIFSANAFVPAAILYATVAALVAVFSELLENVGDGEVPLRLDKWLLALLGILALAGLAVLAKDQIVSLLRQLSILPERSSSHTGEDASTGAEISVKFGADSVIQQWLIASGACFAVMSLLLIALAKTKGDIQDGFIQKVKFISSHGIFSLWIGYGLALGLAFANRIASRILRRRPRALRIAFALLCVAAALTAAIPVYENYTNDRLVFAMGSAEQNGHTFGWQFGNYQLRGANAIREELSADEEPLPNPLYPPEMSEGAIFFGGTDPGRFVPTYMVYSAGVRPDVFLITQNALADETYMSVERDLYGNDIWIPAKEDSSDAFGIYVSEVRSGKRPPNPGLSEHNGRVQVIGALGVMEINGIITKMMFDRERLRHDFYVEESYAIKWMYPYLQPHGLIMKIAPEPADIPGSTVRNDMEFWDWYRRRLLRDKAFRRDFPAQKAFSKLRSAIAGLYSNQGFPAQAAQAYREAVMLYPASPEAGFRYLQEVLFPLRKWEVVRDILDYNDRVDPNNTRTGAIKDLLSSIDEIEGRIDEILSHESEGKPLAATEALELAELYIANSQSAKAAVRLRELLARPGADSSWGLLYRVAMLQSRAHLRGDAARTMQKAVAAMPPTTTGAPSYLATAGKILAEGGLHEDAIDAFGKRVAASPRDWVTLVAMAKSFAALGREKDALEAIRAAFIANEAESLKRVVGDETLLRIASPLLGTRHR
ncbi:MAG: DUF2723 domain-containing protein [Kiritimatiellae bacterium]|nr:DUF2723 domain-containing protein [Kiritimatiellia bacterium]